MAHGLQVGWSVVVASLDVVDLGGSGLALGPVDLADPPISLQDGLSQRQPVGRELATSGAGVPGHEVTPMSLLNHGG